MKKLLSIAAITSLFLVGQANAVVIFENDTDTGTQYNYLLGMDFQVNSTINVTEMGVFDADQNGITGLIKVAIFKLDSLTKTTSSTIVAGSETIFGGNYGQGTLEGGSRFMDVTDFLLGPGYYSVVALGFTTSDKSGNTGVSPFGTTSFNNLGGALQAVADGGRWATDPGSLAIALPTANYGNYSQSDPVFQAGTFKAEVAVPDSGTSIALLGLGLATLVGLRRRIAK